MIDEHGPVVRRDAVVDAHLAEERARPGRTSASITTKNADERSASAGADASIRAQA